MATKRGKKSESKKGKRTAPTPARKPTPRRVDRPATAAKSAATPPLLERAERLRDVILRSKVTHPDPWGYTPKARAWGQRAQSLVDQAAAGKASDALRRDVDALAAEVEGDRDFRDARRLF